MTARTRCQRSCSRRLAVVRCCWCSVSSPLIHICAHTAFFSLQEIEAYAERVAGGYRPPLPERWPQQLRSLVAACWAQDPVRRGAGDHGHNNSWRKVACNSDSCGLAGALRGLCASVGQFVHDLKVAASTSVLWLPLRTLINLKSTCTLTSSVCHRCAVRTDSNGCNTACLIVKPTVQVPLHRLSDKCCCPRLSFLAVCAAQHAYCG